MMSGFLSRSVKFFLCEKELAISHAILSHESLGWGFVYYCCGILWRKRLWLIFKVNRHAMMQNFPECPRRRRRAASDLEVKEIETPAALGIRFFLFCIF